MAVRVVPGAADLVCDLAGRFLLQVLESSDTDAALAALTRARDDIAALPTASTRRTPKPVLSNAVLGPRGPLLLVARLTLDEDLMRTVPDLVAAQLVRASVTATVEVVEPGGPLDDLDTVANAVVLRVFPTPEGRDGQIPPGWIDVAADWVLGDVASSSVVPLRLLGAPFEVVAADAPATLHEASAARTWCDLMSGSMGDRIRTASVTFGGTPHMALAGGGPRCDSEALLARFDLLCHVARELVDGVAYACVDFELTFEGIGSGMSNEGWKAAGGASPNTVAGELVDVVVPDAFPYQIIGPGHLARLDVRAAKVAAPPIGEPLGDRVEVRFGDPIDWLPIYDARRDMLEQGWKLLSDLLVTEDDLGALRRGRNRRNRVEEIGEREGAVATAGPNLDEVVLETVPHPRRGLRLTVLELVAWQAHEAHSDDPRSVSPVLATFVRWFAAGLDPDHLQDLKAQARRLIGTRSRLLAGDLVRPLPPDDDARVWLAADWLARVQAPAWLRLAGYAQAAGDLEAITPTRGNRHLTRVARLLGAAVEMVAGDTKARSSPQLGPLTWTVWEAMAETSGWVAASEAASVRVPERLAYAAELPVIECSRDVRALTAVRSARTTIERAARDAALRAAGEDAWMTGWRAAAAAIDEISMVPHSTASDRATRAVRPRLGLGADAAEVALETADTAGRSALTDAIAARHPPASPWDAGCEAAAESSGGAAWTAVRHMTRDAVGETAWEAGMAAARVAVGRVMQTAPGLIDRAVLVALARETAGLAARAAAGRAAADATAAGAEPDDVARSARDALIGTADTLRDRGFVLLDTLIETRRARPRAARRNTPAPVR